jgi:hypothetical protein
MLGRSPEVTRNALQRIMDKLRLAFKDETYSPNRPS